MDVAGREHRLGLLAPVNLPETISNSALAIGQPSACNGVHSKSLSLVEQASLANTYLTAQTKGFRVFFEPTIRKTARITLVQGLVVLQPSTKNVAAPLDL
jgi:hypothetical protein